MGLTDYTKKTFSTDTGASTTSNVHTEIATLKQTSKAVDTDWLSTNASPTDAPAMHRISIRLATTSVVNLQMDDGTNSNLQYDLNSGTSLTANTVYTFDIVVPSGYSYNIQHKTGTQNVDCVIIELSTESG